MRYLLLILSITLTQTAGFAQPKQVCFTIDDLPVVSYGVNDTANLRDITNRITASCHRNKIPAIGFVNEGKLYSNDQLSGFQVSLLQRWLDQGLELGNHTYSHPDFNSLSFAAFTEDIVKGETVTRSLLQKKGSTLRYFRHPFLHAGHTQARADSLTQFLTARGYTVAPVTIDNEDYVFAQAYKRALTKKDAALATRIGNDYITYMEQKLLYYENISQKLFARNIPHTLLIHASRLNADHLDRLAEMYARNGYTFINLEVALKDPAYKTPVKAFGKWGISWLDRWALSQGKKGDFFKGDVETPQYVKDVTE